MIRVRLLRWLSRRLRVRQIIINGEEYLRRYDLRPRWLRWLPIGIYLHEFLQPDAEPWLHDHPWRYALAWPLVGGYVEQRLDYLDGYDGPVSSARPRLAPFPYLLTHRDFHRIAGLTSGPCWTLFMHTRRFRVWGFLRRDAETGETFYSQPLQKYRAEDFDPAITMRGRDLVNGL